MIGGQARHVGLKFGTHCPSGNDIPTSGRSPQCTSSVPWIALGYPVEWDMGRRTVKSLTGAVRPLCCAVLAESTTTTRNMVVPAPGPRAYMHSPMTLCHRNSLMLLTGRLTGVTGLVPSLSALPDNGAR